MNPIPASKITPIQAIDGNHVRAVQAAAITYAVAVAHKIGAEFPDAVITSVMRSTAAQAILRARYERGQGPPAAKPGTSWHEFIIQAPNVCKWAMDVDRPTVDPEKWKQDLADFLKANKIKFHTLFSEKAPTGWIHIQGIYGGGVDGNPGHVTRI